MKLKLLYVILIILFIILFGVGGFVTYYRNFYSLASDDDIVKLWGSYRRETFNYSDDKMIDYYDNHNLTLDIKDDSIDICYIDVNECFNVKYKKDGNKLIVITDDSKLKAANFEFYYSKDKDGKGLIKMFRKHYDYNPDVYSIFYFTDTLG